MPKVADVAADAIVTLGGTVTTLLLALDSVFAPGLEHYAVVIIRLALTTAQPW